MDDWRDDRIGSAERGANPMVLARMPSGYAVIGDTQFLPGYCLLLASPWVRDLTDLPHEQRQRFLFDMSLLGEAVQRVCRPNGVRRVNYEILGNTEAFLHAHVFPRYTWEPEDAAPMPVWLYPRDRWSDPRYLYDEQVHATLRQSLAAELTWLLQTTQTNETANAP